MSFYFFTDPVKVQPQPDGDNFRVRNSNSDVFQVTSVHKSASNPAGAGGPGSNSEKYPPVIAITKGKICVIEHQSENDLVTIILQPDNQPFWTLPNIRYFIYKGVLKSSLWNTTSNINYKDQLLRGINNQGNLNSDFDDGPDSQYSNSLTLKIWYDHDGFINNNPVPVPNPPTNLHLGVNRLGALVDALAIPDPANVPIDALFYTNLEDNSDDNFLPLPRVEGGWELGRFNKDNRGFGIEIMFDIPGFNPTVGQLIKSNNITPSTSTDAVKTQFSISSASSSFQNAVSKEIILNYLDPSAFYGSLAQSGPVNFEGVNFQGVFVPQNRILPISTIGVNRFRAFNFLNIIGNNIYNQILVGNAPQFSDTFSPENGGFFENRNRIYIDIRDKYGNSFNLFRNDNNPGSTSLENKFSIAFSDGTSLQIDYYLDGRNGNGWPLFTIDDSDFPPTDNLKNNIDISFRNIDRNKMDLSVYVDKVGILQNNISFRNGINERFIYTKNAVGSYQYPISFVFPSITAPSALPISRLIKLRRILHIKEPNLVPVDVPTGFPSPLEYQAQEYLDFLFPLEMDIRWRDVNSNASMFTNVYYEGTYVDNISVSGHDFIGYVGIARDSNPPPDGAPGKIWFFAYDTQPRQNQENGLIDRSYSLPSGVIDFVDAVSFLQNIEDRFNQLLYRRLNIFTEPDTIPPSRVVPNQQFNVEFLENDEIALLQQDRGINGPFNANAAQFNDFITLEMSVTEYESILALANVEFYSKSSFVKGSKVYLGIRVIESGFDQRFNIPYLYYEYVIKGFLGSTLITKQTNVFAIKPIKGIDLLDPLNVVPVTRNSTGYAIDNSLPPQKKIISTIYLIKSPNVSYNDFVSFLQYAQANIRHVWNTSQNLGLTAVHTNNGTTANSQTEQINADEVVLKIATPNQLSNNIRLKQNEVIFLVDNIVQRSAVFGNRRQGNFNVNDRELTPAHEFGHVMGLTDRYTYMAQVNNNNEIQLGGHNVPRYFSDGYDSDYNRDYRWIHNLMSRSTYIPQINNVGGVFSTLKNGYGTVPQRYFLLMTAFSSPDNSDNSNAGNVFITLRQWECIENNRVESDFYPEANNNFYEAVFFVSSNVPFNLENFVGINLNPVPTIPGIGLNTLISDHGISPANNELLTTMDSRFIAGSNMGYFAPLQGMPVINRLSMNDPFTLFILTVGQNPYITFFGNLNALAGPASLTSNANNPALYVPINFLLPALGNQFNNIPFGSGDAFGRNVWNRISVLNPVGRFPLPPVVIRSVLLNPVGGPDFHDVILRYPQHYFNRSTIIQIIRDGA